MKFTSFDKLMFSITSVLCCILIFTACSILERRFDFEIKMNEEETQSTNIGKMPFMG